MLSFITVILFKASSFGIERKSYTFNNQYGGAKMFFIVVNIVCPVTHYGFIRHQYQNRYHEEVSI